MIEGNWTFQHDEWMKHAECLNHDPDIWFPPQGGSPVKAKQICFACPVRDQCLRLAFKLDRDATGGLSGVWAGTTEKERNWVRRKGRQERMA